MSFSWNFTSRLHFSENEWKSSLSALMSIKTEFPASDKSFQEILSVLTRKLLFLFVVSLATVQIPTRHVCSMLHSSYPVDISHNSTCRREQTHVTDFISYHIPIFTLVCFFIYFVWGVIRSRNCPNPSSISWNDTKYSVDAGVCYIISG